MFSSGHLLLCLMDLAKELSEVSEIFSGKGQKEDWTQESKTYDKTSEITLV